MKEPALLDSVCKEFCEETSPESNLSGNESSKDSCEYAKYQVQCALPNSTSVQSNSVVSCNEASEPRPIYRRTSSIQLRCLRRASKMAWMNMSSRWRLDTSLEDEHSDEDREHENKCRKSVPHRKQPIISKQGSDWHLSENAIR